MKRLMVVLAVAAVFLFSLSISVKAQPVDYCEGNFDNNLTVDGLDASTFKADYGRSTIQRPCTNAAPCHGDFSCNGNLDGLDAALFKSDYGRSGINNPCPACETDPWCEYP